MTDYAYQQQPITGEARQRARAIYIRNPISGVPSISYEEERIAEVDGQIIQLPLKLPPTIRGPRDPQLGGQVDLSGEIALRDVSTGELTGQTVPTALIYQALYSDYLNRAFERDAPVVEA